ncbi:uncharacterized protein ACMZJ9_016393 [Mantella aurantiaca]
MGGSGLSAEEGGGRRIADPGTSSGGKEVLRIRFSIDTPDRLMRPEQPISSSLGTFKGGDAMVKCSSLPGVEASREDQGTQVLHSPLRLQDATISGGPGPPEDQDKMPYCSVNNCHNQTGKNKMLGGVVMHTFPRKLHRIKQWLRCIGRHRIRQDVEDLDAVAQLILHGGNNSSFLICSSHFAPGCYVSTKEKRRSLRHDAMPTVFTSDNEKPNWSNLPADAVVQHSAVSMVHASTSTDCHENMEDKGVQWPEFEFNEGGEPWKIQHDHVYHTPTPDAPSSRTGKGSSKLKIICMDLGPVNDDPGSTKFDSGYEPYTSERGKDRDGLNTDGHQEISGQQPITKCQHYPPRMGKDGSHMTDIILNLTLEIMYLLTGEDFTILKKSGEQLIPSLHPRVSRRLNKNQDKKILEVIQKMIGLLTGEVPIRCQDVTVYFSMEEWEYIEGHKDLYKDVMMDNRESFNSYAERSFVEFSAAGSGSGDSSDSDPARDCASKDGSKTRLGSPEQSLEGDPDHYVSPEVSLIIKEEPTSSDDEPFETVAVKIEDQDFLEVNPSSTPIETMSIINADGTFTYIKKESFLEEDDDYSDLGAITDPRESMTCPLKSISDLSSQKCPEGAKWSSDLPAFQDHTGWSEKHQMAAGNPFTCTLCDKSFACNSALETHSRVHTGEKPFSCSKCGKRFMRIAGLCAHEKVHTRERPVQCSECGRCFSSKSRFWRHQVIHTAKIPVSSSDCEKGIDSGPDLVDRVKVQAQEEPYLCIEGGTLANHEAFTHPCRTLPENTPFPCLECGKCFELRSSLHLHQKTHREKQQLPCPFCSKCFPSRSHLERHERIHTGEKPFSCSYCDKKFANRSSVAVHQRIHTGEKPYSCLVCGRCFTDLSGLVVHKRKHDRVMENA